MRKHTDTFPLYLAGGALLLWGLLQNLYVDALKAWVLRELTASGFANQVAVMTSGFIEVVPTLFLSGIIIYAIYWYVWREFEKTNEAFSIIRDVHAESRAVTKTLSTDLYENVFYLAVGNALSKGQILKRVQMRIAFHGPPFIAAIKDHNDRQADLRHGEILFFEIGRIVDTKIFGMLQGMTELNAGAWQAYEHNVPLGDINFDVVPFTGQGYQFGSDPRHPSVWTLRLIISADDVVSKHVSVDVDVTKERPVTVTSIS